MTLMVLVATLPTASSQGFVGDETATERPASTDSAVWQADIQVAHLTTLAVLA